MPSNTLNETGQQWQTWWSIIGPRLTHSESRIFERVVLAPIDEATFNDMTSRRGFDPKYSSTTGSSVVHYPPRDEVQSHHRMQIDVIAVDCDEACQTAGQIANRLLTSLSLTVPGGRYHAELRLVREIIGKVDESAWTEWAGITLLPEPDALQESDIQSALTLFKSIENDPTAENAYVHLLSAWQLQSTAGSKPLKRSILQHYVLCMEAIVDGIMVKVRKELHDRIKLEQRQFAAEFAKTIDQRSDKPKAIKDASTALREIALENKMPAIERAASLLNLGDPVTKEAKELYRFRSSSLSHPGRTEQHGLKKWLHSGPTVDEICRADVIARAFLVRYCASLA